MGRATWEREHDGAWEALFIPAWHGMARRHDTQCYDQEFVWWL